MIHAVLAGAVLVCRLADPRIDEASGIAPGAASPGVLYVHNDSGDEARFFAVDARTGATRATYPVPGASNVDWEDIAVARDARGVSSVWLADTGDNDSSRAEIQVYRVDEPHPGGQPGRADVWRLRYPDGPHDAEALAVAPGGAGYLFTKSLLGDTSVYALPPRPDAARVQTLRRIGTIHFTFTGTPGGPNPAGQLTATGAALSPDGTLLAVRTYTDAYLWQVDGGDLAKALRHKPVRMALPDQPQGEGITISSGRLLVDSEGVGSAVYAVPLPRLTPPATDTPSTAPSTPARADDGSNHPVPIGIVAAALASVAVLVAGLLGLRLRRRR